MRNWKVCWEIDHKEYILTEVECGVPQGRCLGPFLYFIFTNNLFTVLKSPKVAMYADDKTVYTSAQTAVEMTAILKEELENYRLLDFRKQVMVDIT